MNDLEKRIKDLEAIVIAQSKVNDSVQKTIVSLSKTTDTMIDLYKELKMEFNVLKSEITFKN